jgi:hypothetical protein
VAARDQDAAVQHRAPLSDQSVRDPATGEGQSPDAEGIESVDRTGGRGVEAKPTRERRCRHEQDEERPHAVVAEAFPHLREKECGKAAGVSEEATVVRSYAGSAHAGQAYQGNCDGEFPYNGAMRTLLVSTYDLGRQPPGLASPAASLRQAGIDVSCVDASRDRVADDQFLGAALIAFYLPMHTATRLAGPLIERARRANPTATLGAYGLYAPLNAEWLVARGIDHVLGPEAEADLVALATGAPLPDVAPHRAPVKPALIVPDRSDLPPLTRYASLEMPDGSRRVVGSTDATRGCKHLCRHCPIVPVYEGRFRAVPLDVVLADVAAQVAAGAEHITFGDPDFLNGPTHARRLVQAMAVAHPGLSYDATIKIEHLLEHQEVLPVLRETGCLFVTSAVESIDDAVLAQLRKGHTREDFVRAVALCREQGLTLSPTFLPFTPWTTLAGFAELVDTLDVLDLAEQVAPIQLAIRLLVTSRSPLLELDDVRSCCEWFDPESLTWPWRHPDPRVDELQIEVMRLVSEQLPGSRTEVFGALHALARDRAGLLPAPLRHRGRHTVPHVSEPWYCCAEPDATQFESV